MMLGFFCCADPGEAVDLIAEAFSMGLVVEGLSFHVGSQCTNFENYVQALSTSASIIAFRVSSGSSTSSRWAAAAAATASRAVVSASSTVPSPAAVTVNADRRPATTD